MLLTRVNITTLNLTTRIGRFMFAQLAPAHLAANCEDEMAVMSDGSASEKETGGTNPINEFGPESERDDKWEDLQAARGKSNSE